MTVVIGLVYIGILIFLAFVNWHAAVFILLLHIMIHSSNTSNNTRWPKLQQ